VRYGEVLGYKSAMYVHQGDVILRVLDYIVTILFGCVLYCDCFNLFSNVCVCVFCNVWVCVGVGFVMCGSFGNMYICIYCVLYCSYCVFYCFVYVYLFLFVLSVLL